MNINKAIDKQFENKTLREIADLPVDALKGVSEKDAQLLNQAFNIRTIRDLATNKFFKWAEAIVTLADREE